MQNFQGCRFPHDTRIWQQLTTSTLYGTDFWGFWIKCAVVGSWNCMDDIFEQQPVRFSPVHTFSSRFLLHCSEGIKLQSLELNREFWLGILNHDNLFSINCLLLCFIYFCVFVCLFSFLFVYLWLTLTIIFIFLSLTWFTYLLQACLFLLLALYYFFA